MTEIFQQNRNYLPGDPELDLIGDARKLAQWRHKGIGPAYYRLGRKLDTSGNHSIWGRWRDSLGLRRREWIGDEAGWVLEH